MASKFLVAGISVATLTGGIFAGSYIVSNQVKPTPRPTGIEEQSIVGVNHEYQIFYKVGSVITAKSIMEKANITVADNITLNVLELETIDTTSPNEYAIHIIPTDENGNTYPSIALIITITQ